MLAPRFRGKHAGYPADLWVTSYQMQYFRHENLNGRAWVVLCDHSWTNSNGILKSRAWDNTTMSMTFAQIIIWKLRAPKAPSQAINSGSRK